MPQAMDLIDSTVAAEILGVHRATVNRWAYAGRLPAVTKTRGRTGMWLFDRSVVEWFAKQAPPRKARQRPPSAAGHAPGHAVS